MGTVRKARQYDRFQVKTGISFQKEDDSTRRVYSALTVDLSFDGVSIFSPTTVKVGDWMRLWILNPHVGELIRLNGTVAWVSIDDLYGDSPYWVKVGVHFTEVPEAERDLLQKMLPATVLQMRNHKRKHLMAVRP